MPVAYRTVLTIGAAFFAVALVDPIYSAYVPLMLADHVRSTAVVGSILGGMNVLAIGVIPLFSTLSDRTRTRIGRRMPYIVTFLPLTALVLLAVPFAARTGLGAIVLAVLLLNFSRYAARGPIVSLMPDIVPAHERSRANGIINMLGSLSALTVTVFLAPLVAIPLSLGRIGVVPRALPFAVTSVLILAATLLVFRRVREPIIDRTCAERKDLVADSHDSPWNLVRALRGDSWKLLIAVALWFLGYRALTPFLTLYVRDVLGQRESVAAVSFGMIALSQTLFAIPAGFVAAGIGRRRTMAGALVMLTMCGLGLAVFHRIAPRLSSWAVYGVAVILFVFGTAWVVMITNCLPVLWEFAPSGATGAYTGLYYAFSLTAGVAGPAAGGALVDRAGYPVLFVMVAVMFFLAWVVLLRVGADGPAHLTETKHA